MHSTPFGLALSSQGCRLTPSLPGQRAWLWLMLLSAEMTQNCYGASAPANNLKGGANAPRDLLEHREGAGWGSLPHRGAVTGLGLKKPLLEELWRSERHPKAPAVTAPPGSGAAASTARQAPAAAYVRWLYDHSLLKAAEALVQNASQGAPRRPRAFAQPQPVAAIERAPVWFTAYPAAIIGPAGASVLQTLGHAGLWNLFATIGIQGVHTGPLQQAGAVAPGQCRFTPSIDGGFDPIGLGVDASFGTTAQWRALVQTVQQNGGMVIGDLVPGHTGKGADFRLAELGVPEFAGLYHMVVIRPEDWGLLPPVPPGKESVNLSPEAVRALQSKGYIVGEMQRVIGYDPAVKVTNWSASDILCGIDGRLRRVVYLHYFKEGQPTLNWLHPSLSAARLLLGGELYLLADLGLGMVRLDANGFLGLEPNPAGGPAKSEGMEGFARTANELLAGTARQLGGATFQELNLDLEAYGLAGLGGADLSYDFVLRPAYHHALLTGDAEFLRLSMRLAQHYHIDPRSLVHALQNHDELTTELVHFSTTHALELFSFRGQQMRGADLAAKVRGEIHGKLLVGNPPYHLTTANGVASTTASVVAAAAGFTDLTHLSAQQRAYIQKGHLLLTMFNACQGGQFAISGWDLVGALPLKRTAIEGLLQDGDTRWINRGAYDLLDHQPQANASAAGLPRAPALYGSLPAQLSEPDSFVTHLQRLLQLRRDWRLYAAELKAVLPTEHPGLWASVHELPDNRGLMLMALNFGQQAAKQTLQLTDCPGVWTATDLLEQNKPATAPTAAADSSAPASERFVLDGALPVELDGWEGRLVWLRRRPEFVGNGSVLLVPLPQAGGAGQVLLHRLAAAPHGGSTLQETHREAVNAIELLLQQCVQQVATAAASPAAPVSATQAAEHLSRRVCELSHGQWEAVPVDMQLFGLTPQQCQCLRTGLVLLRHDCPGLLAAASQSLLMLTVSGIGILGIVSIHGYVCALRRRAAATAEYLPI